MVDLALIAYSAIAAIGVAAAIILVTNRGAWLPVVIRVVSIVSDGWQTSIDHARAQKARRGRLYSYAAEPVLSHDQTSSWGGKTSSGDPARGQQNHAEPQEPAQSEPVARQLDKEQLIIVLAVQRKENGDYLFSANQITSFVGGTAAPIKNIIANVRGRKETPPPAQSLHRPANGW